MFSILHLIIVDTKPARRPCCPRNRSSCADPPVACKHILQRTRIRRLPENEPGFLARDPCLRGGDQIEIDAHDVVADGACNIALACQRPDGGLREDTVPVARDLEKLYAHVVHTGYFIKPVFCIDLEVPDTAEGEPRILKNNRIEQLKTFRIPAPEALDNGLRIGSLQGNQRGFLEGCARAPGNEQHDQYNENSFMVYVGSLRDVAMRLQNEGTTRTDDR